MTTPRDRLDLVLLVVLIAAWGLLPFTGGDVLADALELRSRPVVVLSAVGLWAVWGASLLCLLVPRALSLTAVRVLVPTSVPAVGWAVLDRGDGSVLAVAGMSLAAAATALVLSAPVGDRFVNGSSYGAERRFALRPPGVLVLGPLVLLWALVVLGVAAGPLLLAAQAWVAGALALLAGWPLAFAASRRAHVLARRWIVLVPAGLVVHDPLGLASSLLARRGDLVHLGPAPADTDALDLTLGALGLAVRVELREPVEVLTTAARRAAGGSYTAAGESARAVLVTPSRPGLLVREAARRRLPIG